MINKPWKFILHLLAVTMEIDEHTHNKEYTAMFDFLDEWIPGDDHREKNINFSIELANAYELMGETYEQKEAYVSSLMANPLLEQKGVINNIKKGLKIVIEADGVMHPSEKKLFQFILDSIEAKNYSIRDQIEDIF